jgi:hypothetical protein
MEEPRKLRARRLHGPVAAFNLYKGRALSPLLIYHLFNLFLTCFIYGCVFAATLEIFLRNRTNCSRLVFWKSFVAGSGF